MRTKIGFAVPCSGHFIQEWRHEIETDQGRVSKSVFMVERDPVEQGPFATLADAEAWCKANPKQPAKRRQL